MTESQKTNLDRILWGLLSLFSTTDFERLDTLNRELLAMSVRDYLCENRENCKPEDLHSGEIKLIEDILGDKIETLG